MKVTVEIVEMMRFVDGRFLQMVSYHKPCGFELRLIDQAFLSGFCFGCFGDALMRRDSAVDANRARHAFCIVVYLVLDVPSQEIRQKLAEVHL